MKRMLIVIFGAFALVAFAPGKSTLHAQVCNRCDLFNVEAVPPDDSVAHAYQVLMCYESFDGWDNCGQGHIYWDQDWEGQWWLNSSCWVWGNDYCTDGGGLQPSALAANGRIAYSLSGRALASWNRADARACRGQLFMRAYDPEQNRRIMAVTQSIAL